MTPERMQHLTLGKFSPERVLTTEGKNPFHFDIFGNPLNWISDDVKLTDDMGKPIFTQPNVKRPDFWSALAIKVVANKYFWGDMLKGERESSVEQLIGRVARFIRRQAIKQGYFNETQAQILHDEIIAICLNQLAVFNSPVWFNVGIQEYHAGAGGVSAWKWDAQTDTVVPALKTDDRPQCSACFIQSIQDTMESIMEVQVAEANLFKAGSGTGTNRSPLRSSREKVTGGGRASGPLSFMKGYDAYAAVIKSGGKTRRAAKMEILNVDHPDILDFILAKQTEEKKAWALIEQGYSGGMNGDAYGSIFFQNSNMSVRVSDEFMVSAQQGGEWWTKMVKTGENCEKHVAKDLLLKIAEGTWLCGDPGMQYDTTINKWHTCKNTARINASNPCVTGDTKVLTEDGKWMRIDALVAKPTTLLTNTGVIQESLITGSFVTGHKPIYKLTTDSGYELKLTADHQVFTVNRGFVPAAELTKDDRLLLPARQVADVTDIDNKQLYQMMGVYLGDGCGGDISSTRGIQLTMSKESELPVLETFASYVAEKYERQTHKNSPALVHVTPTSGKYVITNTSLIEQFKQHLDLSLLADQKRFSDQLFTLPLSAQRYILQGLFTADGTVANYGDRSQYVALDSTSLQLVKDTQLMLLGFGIKSKLYTNRRAGKLTSMLPDGKGGLKEYPVKEVHSLRISRSSRILFEKLIGFMPESPKAHKLQVLNQTVEAYKDIPIDAVRSLDYVGEETVYDLTEPLTHTFVANGITIHNCSEYMFIDDSACNLASINLMKFRNEDGTFDVARYKHVVKILAICMDLLVDGSSYPTAKICRNSRDYRPLGIGYANLGALLMSWGLPYDSDEGRSVAAAITAIMCGEAYLISSELASLVGPFPGFQKNREPMLEVMKMHRDAVKQIDVAKMPSFLRDLTNHAWDSWSDAVEIGTQFGFRNAQMTVLAPTGTIAFMMDCDTTGVEPDIALVKYKVLSGGGMLKMVNRSVPLALRTLGYSEDAVTRIIDFIDKQDTIEGAPDLRPEHLAVFDCAFKPAKGTRSIHWSGHVKMMAGGQPFISGAISKTVNLPETSTIEDIAEAYTLSWKLGLKAVAIYRENSKRSQPLNTKKTEGEMVKKDVVTQPVQIVKLERKKLPQTRQAITHKFEIAGHEGYLTIGLYDDGKPGELFLTMHKVGSTVNGLVDAWATSISMNLQFGIPVDVLFNKFRHQKFEPAGFVKGALPGDLDNGYLPIRTASSIVDYIAQFMLSRFGPGAGGMQVPAVQTKSDMVKQASLSLSEVLVDDTSLGDGQPAKVEEQASLKTFGNEGLVCPQCGGPAKRLGNCAMVCTSCKQTTRSGCGE